MLPCDLHDYIEIACMHHLKIDLSFVDGNHIIGIAHDTRYNKNHEECIQLLIDEHPHAVVLDTILSMTAITKNPHFDTITFK